MSGGGSKWRDTLRHKMIISTAFLCPCSTNGLIWLNSVCLWQVPSRFGTVAPGIVLVGLTESEAGQWPRRTMVSDLCAHCPM
jgi:hypothetical protein